MCKKIILLTVIRLWLFVCYSVCKRTDSFDCFLYWILVSFPFGIHKMYFWLNPENLDIGGSMGVLALNGIIGGLIGGVVLSCKLIGLVLLIIKMTMVHFWTKSPKVGRSIMKKYLLHRLYVPP